MKKLGLLTLILCLSASAQNIGARYLVITHDNFYDAVLPLAQWKHKKGMKCIVKKLSEIGSTQTAIRNYIVNAYNTWDIPPEYILFVGAPNFVPFPTVNGVHSDNYYTNITGDLYNEILSGRLTVHNTTEAQTVVNKILAYERFPYMDDLLWFKKACLIVRRDYDQDDSIYFSDAFYAAQCMVNTGFVEIDTLCDSWGHNSNDIYNAVNEGRSIVMYRGSGLNNWPSPFTVYPDQTQNGSKLPLVLSITCCMMGTGSTPAGAEQWLLTGTPTQPRGASGYFATTTIIMGGAHLRSAVAKGFHRRLFTMGKCTFGQACEGGRQNVYEMYPYQGGINEYYGFHTLGDPEMNIWTDTPRRIVVQHPPFATFGVAYIPVHVLDAQFLHPVANALVCLCGKADTTVYTSDYTDADGYAVFDITPYVIDDTIFVTVTGENLHPYEGYMIVLHATAYVMYLSSVINDTIGGNSDGRISPTEHIELPLTVMNFGESTAVNVNGTLHSADSFITITDSIKNFGDIASLDSADTGVDGFNFTVDSTAANMHIIDFELECRDAYDSVWISHFSHYVYAPILSLEGYTIQGGNGNNTLEPAETVEVIITLKNNGGAAADNATGLLRSSSPFITLLDSTGFFGHVGPDSTQNNDGDPFVVAVHDTAPIGTIANCQLLVSANCCSDTFPFGLIVGQRNYYIWNPDPTPLPGQNCHQILDSLGYDGDYGTTLSPTLSMYQSLFVCLGVYSTQFIITHNSPEAVAIIDFINSGGRVYLEGSSAWFIDPAYHGAHDFGPLFGIDAVEWSLQDLGPIGGATGTFTAGMQFNYGGENWYIDHLEPQGYGYVILSDLDHYYHCGIAQNAGTYRTVGTSFELGLLSDAAPPSTRAALLDSIMHFFGIYTSGVDEYAPNDYTHCCLRARAMPNPCRGLAHIDADLSAVPADANNNVALKIFDITGRLVRTFQLTSAQQKLPSLTITWQGDDDTGRPLPQGIYFIELSCGNTTTTTKLILLK